MRRKFGQRGGRKKVFLSFVLLIIISIYSYYIIEKNIKPTILAMSEINAGLLQHRQ